jgi:hypothetical protein
VDPSKEQRIGSPADSINSIVVNSVDKNNQPASYCRIGPALGFFIKPDLSYYGGDKENPLFVYWDHARRTNSGTSFAAPLISRKLCYLIDVLNIDRESAKALLISSAIQFDDNHNVDAKSMGFGVVPIKIQDIVDAKDDEIKFIIKCKSKKYFTYDYSLPVPIENKKFPYSVKAVFCYFPSCNRNQGVDYTGTELEFKIGKITEGKNKKEITLHDEKENQYATYLSEENARKVFRKWDNVKVIKTKYSSRSGMKAKDNEKWGIRIAYFDRDKGRNDNGELPEISWGLVVTLKALDHKNRIDSFINNCSFNQWLVTKISINERVAVYNQMEETIQFDK